MRATQSRGSSLARLAQAEAAAQEAKAAKAAFASAQRSRLLAEWKWSSPFAEEELDRRLLVLAEEFVYRGEKVHGPVRPLLPTPYLSPREFAATPDVEMVRYVKGILVSLRAGTFVHRLLTPEEREREEREHEEMEQERRERP